MKPGTTSTIELNNTTGVSVSSVLSYSQVLQKKIENSKAEAKVLYNEVEKIKSRLRDGTLIEESAHIKPIPNHSINPKLYNTLKGHQDKISKIQWDSGGTEVMSSSQDGFIIIWDSETGFKKNAIELDNQWVLTCAMSPKGDFFATGGLDNNLTIYDSKRRQNFSLFVFKSHRAYISDCRFLNDQHIISSSGDTKNILWDLKKGGKIRDFVEHTGDVLCLDVFDGNCFVSGSCDGYCKIWDVRQKNPAQNLFISNYDINSLRVHPLGQSFITGLDNGIIKLFDLRSDCELSKYSIVEQLNDNIPRPNNDLRQSILSIESINIMSVDFSSSGRLIYSCYSDFGCLIWDSLKLVVVGSIGGHSNKINQVSVSPNGIGICTASWDGSIKVWAP